VKSRDLLSEETKTNLLGLNEARRNKVIKAAAKVLGKRLAKVLAKRIMAKKESESHMASGPTGATQIQNSTPARGPEKKKEPAPRVASRRLASLAELPKGSKIKSIKVAGKTFRPKE
jgi:hypothetical protein